MGSVNYGVEEVRGLVRNYLRFKELSTPRRMWIFVRILDLERAFRHGPLTHDQRRCLTLCGVLGLTREEGAVIEGVHPTTMDRRWLDGTYALTTWLNGGQPV